MGESPYPKRLIEVDLPIKRISEHARREKSIRRGHISTLHIWWARRPLAACRAVLCAALWPDPADPQCPPAFREAAARIITEFAKKAVSSKELAESCAPDTWGRWQTIARGEPCLQVGNACHLNMLRYLLLDFIADFASWDNSNCEEYLETGRALTNAAHRALGGAPGTRPLVVDPFAGGGAMPLEALRVGADAFASDVNPVAVLLNKVVLEYVPKWGRAKLEMKDAQGQGIVFHGLADAVRYWGEWIRKQAELELARFYPSHCGAATPLAYLWARTIRCEGPNCGAEVPLLHSLWLAKRRKHAVALRLLRDSEGGSLGFEVLQDASAKDVAGGTVRRGAAVCPVCGYTSPVESVRRQLKARRGGTGDARLLCLVTTHRDEQGRFYCLPNESDLEAAQEAKAELARLQDMVQPGSLTLVPDEALDVRGIRHTWGMVYGLERWSDFYTPRQALALATLVRFCRQVGEQLRRELSADVATAVQTCLALAVDRQVNATTSVSRWNAVREEIEGLFARQAIPIVWDFAEANPFSGATGGFDGALNWVVRVCEMNASLPVAGIAASASAASHPLPDGVADALVTDPPYYDAVPYAYLSDFFYVWLRRIFVDSHEDILQTPLVPKDEEIVVDRPHTLSDSTKDVVFYERELTRAFRESLRMTRADGIGTIVFASKTTASWEAILAAIVDAGWSVTGSWPIDTEMAARVAAQGQARLASSIHLVCRPRARPSTIGDWRDVLAELPQRIHSWMPRLGDEGVVGADAIFACLGPALEIYTRYARVEKASGEEMTLHDYLEQVWGAVAREALTMVFRGADASGFEEDARLTAIWFWTLKEAANGVPARNDSLHNVEDDSAALAEGAALPGHRPTGYSMEYDAVRKLAQGLGVDLRRLSQPGGIVTITGNIATLNSVASREKRLVGQQMALFLDNAAHEVDVASVGHRRKQHPSAHHQLKPHVVRQHGGPRDGQLQLRSGPQCAIGREHDFPAAHQHRPARAACGRAG